MIRALPNALAATQPVAPASLAVRAGTASSKPAATDGFSAAVTRPAGPDLGAAQVAAVAPRPAGFTQQGPVLGDGAWVRPEQSTAHVFDSYPPTYGTQTHPETSVDLRISLDDAALRQQLPGFDGLERPFVMIPSEKDGQITWWRHELKYSGSGREGFYADRAVDTYRLETVHNVDRAAVEKYGILVGVDTNVGTAWAQGAGSSHRVPERSRV